MELQFTQTEATAVASTYHNVPTADVATNTTMRDVIGNKSDTVNATSIMGYVKRIHGTILSKQITLSANNTTASVNIFQLTGTVKIRRLYAFITEKTTLANLTVGSFDLYDSTAVVQLTKADGVLSGCAVGTFIVKSEKNDMTWAKADNVAGAIVEPTYEGSELFSYFTITQKTGANTYVRFTYTTTDAPINAKITVYAEYIPLGGGTLEAVA